MVVLDVYGSLFYTGARTLQARLPDPAGAEEAVVVLRLRGRTTFGATFFSVVAAYADRLEAGGGRLYLAGVDPALVERLERYGRHAPTGSARLFRATEVVGESTVGALADAEAWLVRGHDGPPAGALTAVLQAFALGVIAQSSLLVAGLTVYRFTFSRRFVGMLAGFGAGAMLAAVSFDLVAEARGLTLLGISAWMLAGVAVFILGDRYVERRFGDGGTGGAMGIVVGSVVDGVPESMILGIQLATHLPVSASFIMAVMVSNVPQAIAPSAELAEAGWSPRRLGRLWALVVLACGLAAALGYGYRQPERRLRRGGARRPGRRWPARPPHELAHALRLRARRRAGRAGHRDRLLRLPRLELIRRRWNPPTGR